jgi:hypothetical protein
MKAALSLPVCLLACLMFAPVATFADEAEREIVIGEKAYPIKEGEPLTVTLPSGERITLNLRRRDLNYWTGNRIRFTYPTDFNATAEEEDGAKMIVVEGGESTLAVVQIYPVSASLKALATALPESLRKQIKGKGGTIAPGKPGVVKRKIGTTMKEGIRLQWQLEGKRNTTEVYVFNGIQNRIAVVFQWEEGEALRAASAFRLMAESFGIEKP